MGNFYLASLDFFLYERTVGCVSAPCNTLETTSGADEWLLLLKLEGKRRTKDTKDDAPKQLVSGHHSFIL